MAVRILTYLNTLTNIIVFSSLPIIESTHNSSRSLYKIEDTVIMFMLWQNMKKKWIIKTPEIKTTRITMTNLMKIRHYIRINHANKKREIKDVKIK